MPDPNRDYARVEQAIQFLNDNARRQPELDDVARHVGLSSSHFQRLFTRWAGVSPKRFLQHLTLSTAKRSLEQDATLFDATLDAGLSSASRLHDLFVTIEAMTPGEFKDGGRGLEIAWHVVASPFGPCVIARTHRGISSLDFPREGSHEAAHNGLRERWPNASLHNEPEEIERLAKQVFAPLFGQDPVPLSLHLKGTNFQLQVWRALLSIEVGSPSSYGEIARSIGKPSSSRAVGQAVGSNPVSYLVPCHRVLTSTGALGGYHWGKVRKQAMLAREEIASALKSEA